MITLFIIHSPICLVDKAFRAFYFINELAQGKWTKTLYNLHTVYDVLMAYETARTSIFLVSGDAT